MKRFFIITSLFLIITFSLFFFIFGNNKKQPDLTVMGFINKADGLGRQSAELIEAFENELSVNFIPTRAKKHLPAKYKKLLKHPKKTWGKVIIFEDMLWAPKAEYFQKITNCDPNSIKYAYSMWESSKIPNEWVIILNKYFDAVLVPSDFLVDIYKNCGVKIPVFELPLGLNLTPFAKEPLKTSCGCPMVFGNLSACSDRKNHLILIRAFAKAFGNDPSVLLRINCRYGEPKVRKVISKEIATLNLNNVIFTQFSFNSKEYLEEFKNIDCYVSPSKGEGFSIQPREAMLLGIPVIVTNNTGQAVISRTGLVKSIESLINEIALYPSGDFYGHNYNCNLEDLAEAMKEIKEDYNTYLSIGPKARNWALKYDYQNLQPLYRCIITPPEIVLCDKNEITEHCLYTNSENLTKKYGLFQKNGIKPIEK